MLRTIAFFKWAIASTVAALVAAYLYDGAGAVAIVALLIALEASISFDNAVVNATVLRRMSERWQRVFLTVGIVIAVFGMRVAFPILIVAISTALGVTGVVELAFEQKAEYAERVEAAAPTIGGFGGMFLLLVFLDFFTDPDKEVEWAGPLERPLKALGKLRWIPAAVAAGALLLTSQLVPDAVSGDVLVAGLAGMVTFMVVNSLSSLAERVAGDEGRATGAAGLAAFLYLEMLDASFSLDGVLGAFAISKDIVVIALGLGVGAIYVRSLTVYLVRERALQRYRYLKHGAHWAIGMLAVVLLASTSVHVPEWLVGTIGLSLIVAAVVTSVVHNRRHGEDDD